MCLVNEDFEKQFMEDLQKSLDTLATLTILHAEPRKELLNNQGGKSGW